MNRWDEREVGEAADTGNVEYFRALKRTSQPAASAPAEAYPSEKRRSPRYKCEGSAEFRFEGSTVRTWATVTDVSRSGCYVEMQTTSPADTKVDMIIEVMGIRASVKGVVRVSYPFLGMGIAFTEITPEQQVKLDELLLRLASGVQAPAYTATDPLLDARGRAMPEIADPRGALQAVTEFFANHRVLTREQFLELLEKHAR